LAKISIITINYNNAVGLQKTIDSVINQSFQDFEFILIDGNSTDNSLNIIKQTSRVNEWVSEKDNGIYDAQNKGILKANGDYFLFLNSGDILVNNQVLQKASVFLAGNKSFYYGNLILEKNALKQEHIAPKIIDMDFMLNSTFWHPSVFIKSDLFKQYGNYNNKFKICGDYEFFIRCLLKPVVTAEYINELITVFDGNGISNDTSMIELQKQERESAWKLNVSELVYNSLKTHNAFARSKFASVINYLQKIRGQQEF
jgi:glycosyltransferase involved in cell wall biosynthesis